MTKVYLVCAPETETESFRFLQGQSESPLSRQGAMQCRALQNYFREIRPDRIHASCQSSAVRAAEAIAAQCGTSVEQNEALNEIGLGAWDSCPAGNLAFDEPEMFRRFQEDPFRWGADGAEDPEEAAARIEAWLRRTIQDADGQTVVVVSHKYILRLLMTRLFGGADERTVSEGSFGNGSVTLLEADGENYYLADRSQTGHIQSQRDKENFPDHQDPEFDSTLYYQWLRAVEYGEIFADAVESVWHESGKTGPFRRFDIIDDASRYETIIGYAEQTPAGFLQYGLMDGTIELILSHPGARGAGIGTQLVGKAVMDARVRGWDCLVINLPEHNPYRQFFENLGFEPAGKTASGEERYVKSIL